MNWTAPILIYQMGKVGSASIQASLDARNLSSIHAHFLSWQSLADVEKYYLGLPHANLPEHVSRSKRLRAIIDETWGRIRWKVITLVREPVARTISDVFQNLTFSMPHINDLDKNNAFEQISAYTLEQFNKFDEKKDYICTWFDKEIKDVFNLDIYALKFNKRDGFQIFTAENADILLIKLEKLSECHQQAFQDFLGIQNFQLIMANVGNQKPYKRLYDNVLDSISIPDDCLDRIYTSRFARHFYTPDEIQMLKRRWLGQPTTGTRTDLNADVFRISSSALSIANDKNGRRLLHSNSAREFNYPRQIKSSETGNRQYLPTISLVTPSYNQGEYLDECIDSVLSQNYPNLEYIIMDGGSTDDSVEIIKRYEKYLTHWQSQPDGGQYAAINEGFRRTRGEIMTWLNSDDKFHPHAFFTVAGVFTLRNDVDWISGRMNTFSEQGDQFWICEYLLTWERSKYLRKQFMDPWIQQEGTFWRRRLWERAGSTMRTDMDFASDLELWTRFFRYSQLYAVDMILAGYRFQPKSKARLFMDKYLQEANRVLDEELQLFEIGVHRESMPSPEPIRLKEIQRGLALIQDRNNEIASLINRRAGLPTLMDGHQTALDFYEKSVKANPNHAGIRNSLGMLYWQNGKVRKAIGEFLEALRVNHRYPEVVLNLGDVLTRIKQVDKAEKLYATYLSMNPRDKALFKKFANVDH